MKVEKLTLNMFTDGEDVYALEDFVCVKTSYGKYTQCQKGVIREMDDKSFVIGVDESKTNLVRFWYDSIDALQLIRRGEEYSKFNVSTEYAAFGKNKETGIYEKLPLLHPQENRILMENRVREAIRMEWIPARLDASDIQIKRRFSITYVSPWTDDGLLSPKKD